MPRGASPESAPEASGKHSRCSPSEAGKLQRHRGPFDIRVVSVLCDQGGIRSPASGRGSEGLPPIQRHLVPHLNHPHSRQSDSVEGLPTDPAFRSWPPCPSQSIYTLRSLGTDRNIVDFILFLLQCIQCLLKSEGSYEINALCIFDSGFRSGTRRLTGDCFDGGIHP